MNLVDHFFAIQYETDISDGLGGGTFVTKQAFPVLKDRESILAKATESFDSMDKYSAHRLVEIRVLKREKYSEFEDDEC